MRDVVTSPDAALFALALAPARELRAGPPPPLLAERLDALDTVVRDSGASREPERLRASSPPAASPPLG